MRPRAAPDRARTPAALGLAAAALLTFALAARPAAAGPVRPHVLFVVDTSAAQLSPPGQAPGAGDGKDGSALCGGQGMDARLFRIKQALRAAVTEAGVDDFNYGLQRFPQTVAPTEDGGCPRGHYGSALPAGPEAGCRTSAPAEDAAGDFFTPPVAEQVVAVPVTAALPPRGPEDFDPRGGGVPDLLRWLDNLELSDGARLTNPELRAFGARAPLANALLYARLYFQRFVVPQDGRARCRKNVVVLLSVGPDTCGGDAPARAAELFEAGMELHVLADAAHASAVHDAVALQGSGGERKRAVIVDFTDARATKAALLAALTAIAPPAEVCNGVDDTCDGRIDEGPLPFVGTACLCPGLAEANVGRGACRKGALVCRGTAGLVCEGCGLPTPERCNGLDDDCDGLVDEDFPQLGRVCDNGGLGACVRRSLFTCSPDGADLTCDAPPGTPAPEICNGIDDDCNGAVDDGPLPGEGVPCGEALGICMAGRTRCEGGRMVCSGEDAGKREETCNGLDDDCNGLVDDGVVGAGEACLCAPHDARTLTTGECRPGRLACGGGAALVCEGCVPPRQEVCDCKDNDCDGAIDEDAPCGQGFACVGCRCEIACAAASPRCPSGFACDEKTSPPVCRSLRCQGVTCDPGWRCDEGTGRCVDPCKDVTCPAPQRCEQGRCVDCYTTGCPQGLLCLSGQCRPNPCAGVRCDSGRYCDRGACVPLCAATCGPGALCVAGQCRRDACAGVACDDGRVCDPVSGQCRTDVCRLKTCPGQTCVPTTGECRDDPCKAIVCPDTCHACEVTNDGVGHCEPVPQCTPAVIQVESGGGGGCTCALGAGGVPALPAPLVLAVVPGAAALVRRRWKRCASKRGRR